MDPFSIAVSETIQEASSMDELVKGMIAADPTLKDVNFVSDNDPVAALILGKDDWP